MLWVPASGIQILVLHTQPLEFWSNGLGVLGEDRGRYPHTGKRREKQGLEEAGLVGGMPLKPSHVLYAFSH